MSKEDDKCNRNEFQLPLHRRTLMLSGRILLCPVELQSYSLRVLHVHTWQTPPEGSRTPLKGSPSFRTDLIDRTMRELKGDSKSVTPISLLVS